MLCLLWAIILFYQLLLEQKCHRNQTMPLRCSRHLYNVDVHCFDYALVPNTQNSTTVQELQMSHILLSSSWVPRGVVKSIILFFFIFLRLGKCEVCKDVLNDFKKWQFFDLECFLATFQRCDRLYIVSRVLSNTQLSQDHIPVAFQFELPFNLAKSFPTMKFLQKSSTFVVIDVWELSFHVVSGLVLDDVRDIHICLVHVVLLLNPLLPKVAEM